MLIVSPLDRSIALLQSYAGGNFPEELIQSLQKTAQFICTLGRAPPQASQMPRLEPLLDQKFTLATSPEDRALLAHCKATLILNSCTTTQEDSLAALTSLETHLFNPDFIAESRVSPQKRALLKGTTPLRDALESWEHRNVSPLREKMAFLRQLISAVTVADEIFLRKEYLGPVLLFQIHRAYPKDSISLALVDKFAAEALKGQERKYLIALGSIQLTQLFLNSFLPSARPS